ncbi:MAG: bifunctional phosphopantothenoylcysteine decarboxylase/phosphopantothenate--cysteine ligase CoaBC [Methylococcaceae bacterium]|nr:bifunctional phosphopantothenoylcysteine decarboxylase/phosphopantothenate--cysteine ligase CoaBC [Methylococcaceae bacterium]
MSQLARIRVLLGVTGGIAAYKAAELTRLLRAEGAEVIVVITAAAARFVGPLTFQALSGNRVHQELLDAAEESAMDHISLARWADRVLIAPATADFLARLRAGLADDLLTTLCLATRAPILVVPAMNTAMWEHPATQENIGVLRDRGVMVLGPGSGALACGEIGAGRMLDPAQVIAHLEAQNQTGSLAGRSVLVTAGPTREPIDPVRFIGNRSSGKMGYAIAEQAARRGARVTLVSGPTQLADPKGVEVHRLETADQMYQAVMARVEGQDIVIGAAAVADYTPVSTAAGKIKKTEAEISVSLMRTRDIIGAVAALPRRPPLVVGFAAETHDLQEYALSKLRAKGLDLIAANRIGAGQGGFDSDENSLEVYWEGGARSLALASKPEIAGRLMDLIVERLHAKNSAEDPR